MSIIGGSDGPTDVFIAGKLGMDWLNVFGLILVILLLIPNIGLSGYCIFKNKVLASR